MSLTCVLCKVLESIVRDVLVNHMNEANLFADCQHGFRKHRSCMTQLLQVIEDFSLYLDNKEPFDVLYLDFKKAFDSVPHQRLLVKLRGYGICGNLLDWISDFLINRTQRVKCGNSYSTSSHNLRKMHRKVENMYIFFQKISL